MNKNEIYKQRTTKEKKLSVINLNFAEKENLRKCENKGKIAMRESYKQSATKQKKQSVIAIMLIRKSS